MATRKSMIASKNPLSEIFEPTTRGQVGNLLDKFSASLIGVPLPRGAMQKEVIEDRSGIRTRMLILQFKNAVLDQAEAECDIIARTVLVNRSEKPRQAFRHFSRSNIPFSFDEKAAVTMPPGNHRELETVYFFRIPPSCTDEEQVQKMYSGLGLVMDWQAQLAVCLADPIFVINHRNHCQWQGEDGIWRQLDVAYDPETWRRLSDDNKTRNQVTFPRSMLLIHKSDQHHSQIRGGMWFAGVRPE